MRSKSITQISPHLIDGHLIIALDEKWIETFQGIPTFQVEIDGDGKLCLRTSKALTKVEPNGDD